MPLEDNGMSAKAIHTFFCEGFELLSYDLELIPNETHPASQVHTRDQAESRPREARPEDSSIYIYIHRERGRKRECYIYIYIYNIYNKYIYIYMCDNITIKLCLYILYIYIY